MLQSRCPVWISGLPTPDSGRSLWQATYPHEPSANQKQASKAILQPYLRQPQVFCFFFSKKKISLYPGIGTAQISEQYSRMARSEENQATFAVFSTEDRHHPAWSRHRASTARWQSE